MSYFRKHIKIIGLLLFACFIISVAFSQTLQEIIISSHGTISNGQPVGKLSIGDPDLGQNPSLFYDETGKPVTLRIGHAWAEEWQWWQRSTLDSTKTWAEIDIELMKNTSRNAMRIHMMPVYFFDNEGNPIEETWALLMDTLQDFEENDLYFILDWYQFTPNHDEDYWMREQWSDWSLFWNTTVQDDFIATLDYTVERLKAANVYDHMVYLTPSNEVFWTSYNNIQQFWREGTSPYRHSPTDLGGTGEGMTNVAAISWHNWLRNKYNNDLNAIKAVWGTSGDEYFNYTGDENDFSSIRLSNNWDSNRQRDFQAWADESAIDYTKRVIETLKGKHPDLYVGWDVQRISASSTTSDTKLGWSCYVPTVYGDLVDFHFYSYSSDVYQEYVMGDAWQWERWQTAAAFARALEKPLVVSETGVLGGGGTGVTDYEQVKASWEIIVSLSISNSLAGVCPWYIQSYQGRRPSWWDMTWEPEYQAVWRSIMDEYKFAETWLDEVKYDKITIVAPRRAGGDTAKLYMNCLRQAGYNPQYLVFEIDEDTIYPSIPEDTEIVILAGGKYRTRITSDYLIEQIDSVLDNGAKLILTDIRSEDFFGSEKRWEQTFDTSRFPLSSVSYGDTYKLAYNTTDAYLNVYDQQVLIQRSADWCWYSSYYVEWDDASITGTQLINTANGEPWVITNNQVAWISAIYLEAQGWQGSALSPYDQEVPNTYLILKRILENWSIYPVAITDNTPIKLEYTYASADQTWGVLYLNNIKTTTTNTLTIRIDAAVADLDTTADYMISVGSGSEIFVSGAELSNEVLTIEIPAKWSETIIIQAIE